MFRGAVFFRARCIVVGRLTYHAELMQDVHTRVIMLCNVVHHQITVTFCHWKGKVMVLIALTVSQTQ